MSTCESCSYPISIYFSPSNTTTGGFFSCSSDAWTFVWEYSKKNAAIFFVLCTLYPVFLLAPCIIRRRKISRRNGVVRHVLSSWLLSIASVIVLLPSLLSSFVASSAFVTCDSWKCINLGFLPYLLVTLPCITILPILLTTFQLSFGGLRCEGFTVWLNRVWMLITFCLTFSLIVSQTLLSDMQLCSPLHICGVVDQPTIVCLWKAATLSAISSGCVSLCLFFNSILLRLLI